MTYQIGIVDDHKLFARSIALMLESFSNFDVAFEVNSGEQMKQIIPQMPRLPDIILLDVNMPGINGVDCANWLSQTYPAIKVAALTMNDTEVAILGMIQAGCCSYLLKNTHPNEFERALLQIAEQGFYHSETNLSFKELIRLGNDSSGITDAERRFIQYACSDFTYRNIARMMKCSERTIENYRNNVFAKLNVQTRIGMAMEAIRRGLVKP